MLMSNRLTSLFSPLPPYFYSLFEPYRRAEYSGTRLFRVDAYFRGHRRHSLQKKGCLSDIFGGFASKIAKVHVSDCTTEILGVLWARGIQIIKNKRWQGMSLSRSKPDFCKRINENLTREVVWFYKNTVTRAIYGKQNTVFRIVFDGLSNGLGLVSWAQPKLL